MSAEVEHKPNLNPPNMLNSMPKPHHPTPKKETDKRKPMYPQHKKFKHEESRHFKHGRKRQQSFSGNGKFCPPYKRRKKGDDKIIPPTKFLLGGNICDPLNLNSMQDEEVNRAMNAVTPKSSPLPTPKHRKGMIEVIIPPNICDPLNLSNCNDDEYEKQLISPTKKNSKRRNKKRKRASSGSAKEDSLPVEKEAETMGPPLNPVDTAKSSNVEDSVATPSVEAKEPKLESPQKDKNKLRLKGLDEIKDKKGKKLDIKDKIVSPVIPQPGAWKTRPPHWNNQEKKKNKKQQNLPKFNPKNEQFKFGNYNRYYGYRNLNHAVDLRLVALARRKELFRGKDVLDIGCNTGHVTLAIANDFGVKSTTGIDIDGKLIKIARKNIKHYVNRKESPRNEPDEAENGDDVKCFPISMPINYGPIAIPGFAKQNNHKGFPYNVTFVQGNYVLDDDKLLLSEQPQFDTILCLSTTKWIHLNFGDAGLKQTFKRIFAQLRPGGVLILESQSWSSYGKRKRLTERIYKNYHSIEFYPHKFTQYLLSTEVGFNKCEVLSVGSHPSKGFQRPIHLYTKAAESQESPTIHVPVVRHAHEAEERLAQERRIYERELFPDANRHSGKTSQRSNESLSQWDQLANVYAPSATPCYDTPNHNSSGQTPEPQKTYYVGVVNETAETPRSETTPERLETVFEVTEKLNGAQDGTPRSDTTPDKVEEEAEKFDVRMEESSGEINPNEADDRTPPSGELSGT